MIKEGSDPETGRSLNSLRCSAKEWGMIPDHLAFSTKLSARALASLGGPTKGFADDFYNKGHALKLIPK
jgi:hypothetical protein